MFASAARNVYVSPESFLNSTCISQALKEQIQEKYGDAANQKKPSETEDDF